MNSKFIQQVLMTCLFLSLAFISCKKEDDGNNGGGGGHDGNQKTVSISNFSFSPSSIMINNGETVTWTNNDNAPHTVTADDNSFTSGTLNKGDTYSHKFTSAGTVNYHCNLHPSMTASVMVH